MRYVRVRGPSGFETGRVEDGRIVTDSGTRIDPLDPDTLQLPAPYELVAPFDAPEIWCAGVTYERSRDARVEESAVKDVYTMVYDAAPELFMKDAMMRRTVGPGARSASARTRPGTCPSRRSASCSARTVASRGTRSETTCPSRDIEGANPLYLPQAKIYAGACSFGPSVFVSGEDARPFELTLRVTDEWGQIVFEGETSTARMKRSFDELVHWLTVDNPVPYGSILLTGTGLVPPDSFTLLPGHFVEIHVPEIGTLVNPVVRASELIEKEPLP